MRHVFIINPVAGPKSSARELLKRVEAVFPPEDVEVYATRGAGDAGQLAHRALEPGEPVRLYACGGDGTLNEVVNAAAGKDWAAVTNVPMGTGNDFLRIFGREGKNRFTDLAALRDGPQSAMDLVDCNGVLGLDVVCVGVDARVAADVHRFKRLPLIGKKMAYILSLIATVRKGITQPMRVDMGPIHHEGPTALVCVCNGQYYGGGFRPVPEARPDDQVLDALLVGDVSFFQFIRCVGKYASGRYKECSDLVRDWHGGEVSVSAHEELVAVVDGEVLRGHSFTIRLSERKVNFFHPAGVELWVEKTASAAAI